MSDSLGTIIYKQVINIMNQLNIIDFNESGLTAQLFITFIWGFIYCYNFVFCSGGIFIQSSSRGLKQNYYSYYYFIQRTYHIMLVLQKA